MTFSASTTFDRHGEPVHQADTDADFRVVASMLLALDPDQRWGGLSRTVTSEGLSLYVCSDHLAGYR
jgi:internalin A